MPKPTTIALFLYPEMIEHVLEGETVVIELSADLRIELHPHATFDEDGLECLKDSIDWSIRQGPPVIQ
jgi:hypothetical protein